MEQSKRIDAELKKLEQTPAGQEVAAMQKKFEDGISEVSKAREEIQDAYMKLHQTEAYRDYEKSGASLKTSAKTNGPSNGKPWPRRQGKSMRPGMKN
jgi:hypothetical protein